MKQNYLKKIQEKYLNTCNKIVESERAITKIGMGTIGILGAMLIYNTISNSYDQSNQVIERANNNIEQTMQKDSINNKTIDNKIIN